MNRVFLHAWGDRPGGRMLLGSVRLRGKRDDGDSRLSGEARAKASPAPDVSLEAELVRLIAAFRESCDHADLQSLEARAKGYKEEASFHLGRQVGLLGAIFNLKAIVERETLTI